MCHMYVSNIKDKLLDVAKARMRHSKRTRVNKDGDVFKMARDCQNECGNNEDCVSCIDPHKFVSWTSEQAAIMSAVVQ